MLKRRIEAEKAIAAQQADAHKSEIRQAPIEDEDSNSATKKVDSVPPKDPPPTKG